MSLREQLQRELRVLSERLARMRERLGAPLQELLSRPDLSRETLLQELERILLGADVGVELTERLLQHLRQQRCMAQELKPSLRQQLLQLLPVPPPEQLSTTPTVVLVVGVNGSGKTTTAAKLAWRRKCLGKQPLLAAADTFRAAAIEQLAQWAEQLRIPLIRQQYGADPAAVAYDALRSTQARAIDVLIVDTAGRLHTKTPLMVELEKLVRVLRKLDPTAPHEVFLVLDAVTGHNASPSSRRIRTPSAADWRGAYQARWQCQREKGVCCDSAVWCPDSLRRCGQGRRGAASISPRILRRCTAVDRGYFRAGAGMASPVTVQQATPSPRALRRC